MPHRVLGLSDVQMLEVGGGWAGVSLSSGRGRIGDLQRPGVSEAPTHDLPRLFYTRVKYMQLEIILTGPLPSLYGDELAADI